MVDPNSNFNLKSKCFSLALIKGHKAIMTQNQLLDSFYEHITPNFRPISFRDLNPHDYCVKKRKIIVDPREQKAFDSHM